MDHSIHGSNLPRTDKCFSETDGMEVRAPGARTGPRQTQWPVCYKYTHRSAKAEIKLLQRFYQAMHTPATGTVAKQAKSQTARHEQISHHSSIPAHPWLSVKVHPQTQLSPSLLTGLELLRPSFLHSSRMGHMLQGSTSREQESLPGPHIWMQDLPHAVQECWLWQTWGQKVTHFTLGEQGGSIVWIALSALQIASVSPRHPHLQAASKTSTLA